MASGKERAADARYRAARAREESPPSRCAKHGEELVPFRTDGRLHWVCFDCYDDAEHARSVDTGEDYDD